MSVWLSTTMIQALRNLIDLYTFYFETLERTLDGLLDLLCVCICQGTRLEIMTLFNYLLTYSI
jgi:brefeldin A-inhibited guanine nucleotide-exchange protein